MGARVQRVVPMTKPPTQSKPAKLLLSLEDAARAMGIGISSLKGLMADGTVFSIPVGTVGKSRRIPVFEVTKWVAEHGAPVPKSPDRGDYRQDVRYHARTVLKEKKSACARCGYSMFVNVCHIRPVRTFPPDTPIEIINAPDNLVALCPNCHRELDAGLFTL